MMISCRKCAGVVCVCGFLATAAVAVSGDGKPPPARTAAALTGVMTTSTSQTVSAGSSFMYVHDEVIGALRTVVLPGGRMVVMPAAHDSSDPVVVVG
jgi:hypothetical protein